MKKFSALILMLFITNLIYTQDLIVTNEKDTINCKITKIKKDKIYFTFKHNDEIRNTLLLKSSVKFHQYDFYKTSIVPKSKLKVYQNYPRFRLAINSGYSHHTAKVASNVPADFKSYVKDLMSGYHFSGDLEYFFSEPVGVGLKYTVFKSSNKINEIYIDDNNGNRVYGNLSDDLTISFFGPTVLTRLLNHDKSNAFIFGLSLGYLEYSNEKVAVDAYKITGSTFGTDLNIGYEIGLSENFSLGFQVTSLIGLLTEYDISDGRITQTISLEKEEYESLNRIDFSVGIRFTK